VKHRRELGSLIATITITHRPHSSFVETPTDSWTDQGEISRAKGDPWGVGSSSSSFTLATATCRLHGARNRKLHEDEIWRTGDREL